MDKNRVQLSDFPEWKAEQPEERYQKCIAVLYINGLITHGERTKIHERLRKKSLDAIRAELSAGNTR